MTPQALRSLLHPDFRWVSHTGERFDRESYIASNTGGATRWAARSSPTSTWSPTSSTAVLRCQVVDEVDRGDGLEEFRMPMTQVWVRHEDRWVCLAGHAGPVLAPTA